MEGLSPRTTWRFAGFFVDDRAELGLTGALLSSNGLLGVLPHSFASGGFLLALTVVSVGLIGGGMDRTNADAHRQGFRANENLHASAVKLATKHSSEAGAKLGSQSSDAKAAAAQENGKQGGRPVGS